ncbi:Gfo/Idh/MocA family protein [Thalassobacillus pellis]|uniref:Gfo/Idh/MocA family protein n=1 Tax=Thalassobacillus pellis TaxID=748008 RepID=UPI0019621AE8|nr:Gfo/Idh/MocA family oxidoreductase [Thalassobacillus pellis]MBM7552032.1 putative dehydrogenase [Thalassobacillus pellis]
MVRFGVIGTNFITERLLEHVKDMEDFKLTAVYSRTNEKARVFADKYGAAETYTDIEEMAASANVDAVYIASPNSLHVSQSITVMNCGKHVLCEKPLASTSSEVEKMFAAARRNDVLLMEAMKTTFVPNFLSIQQHLSKIGKIRRYVGTYCKYSSRYDAYKEGTVLNTFNPVFSNGSLMDLGVYCIYPMIVLFGTPHQTKASGVKLETGVDGEGSVLFQYEEMEGVVMHSKISTSFSPSEIQGELGSILIDNISDPAFVEIRYKDGRKEDITKEYAYPSMYYEVDAFINLIKEGKRESSINSFSHSFATIQTIETARKQIGITYPADQ